MQGIPDIHPPEGGHLQKRDAYRNTLLSLAPHYHPAEALN
jgi:hypothetical protein